MGRTISADGPHMDISGSAMRRWLRELGPFGAETCRFARRLGDTSPSSERLFVLGTPDFEPWHFVAHLGEQATRYGRTDLVPTLMRWRVPANAPAHLSVGVNNVRRFVGVTPSWSSLPGAKLRNCSNGWPMPNVSAPAS